MEEHIYPAQVVGGQVDFLSKEPLSYIVLTQYLCCFQKEGTRTTGWVIDLVYLGLSNSGQLGQELTHFLGCIILTTRLACIAGIHTHQVLIGISKGIYGVVLVVSQFHRLDTPQQLDQFFISLDDSCSQLVGIDIQVCKQSLEVILTLCALCRVLNGCKDALQGHIQVGVSITNLADILKELGRKDEETLYSHHLIPCSFCCCIIKVCIIEGLVSSLPFTLVDICCDVLTDVPVK